MVEVMADKNQSRLDFDYSYQYLTSSDARIHIHICHLTIATAHAIANEVRIGLRYRVEVPRR